MRVASIRIVTFNSLTVFWSLRRSASHSLIKRDAPVACTRSHALLKCKSAFIR